MEWPEKRHTPDKPDSYPARITIRGTQTPRRKLQKEALDGKRGDSMPRDGTHNPDRHRGGSTEVQLLAGVLRRRILPALQRQPSLVRAGCVGRRAARQIGRRSGLIDRNSHLGWKDGRVSIRLD